MESGALNTIASIFSPVVPVFTRIIYLLTILIILYVVDRQMGFTHHYFAKSKAEEISKYNEILKDLHYDSATQQLLKQEIRNIIVKERGFDIFNNVVYKSSNRLLNFISCSWIFLIFMFFVPIFLRSADPNITKREVRTSSYALVVVFIILIAICYIINLPISAKYEPPTNYLINTSIQIIMLITILWYGNYIAKKKEKKARQSEA